MPESHAAVPAGGPRHAAELRFHHIGIQTEDLDNCVRWYRDFFGCRPSWSLDTFSELTLSRLPGIVRLVELVRDDVRFHLFERPGHGAVGRVRGGVQFQHLCMSADSADELVEWRRRWRESYASGHYIFAVDEQPTEIVEDADGTKSFYALDVNGLEYEFTYVPAGVR